MPFTLIKKVSERIVNKIQTRFGVNPLVETQADIEAWFKSPAGLRLLEVEQARLNRIMPEMYGYHLMRLSPLTDSSELSQQSPVTHHFSFAAKSQGSSSAFAEFEKLPVDAESLDVALLHHTLEYSTNPHQLLRETARCVIPNGYIIILGFNPNNLSSIFRQCGRLVSGNAQRHYHNLFRWRLLDWLRLLDFEPAIVEYGSSGLPGKNKNIKKLNSAFNASSPFLGDFYIIVARKSTFSLNIIKPDWKKTPLLGAWGKRKQNQQVVNKSVNNQKSNTLH